MQRSATQLPCTARPDRLASRRRLRSLLAPADRGDAQGGRPLVSSLPRCAPRRPGALRSAAITLLSSCPKVDGPRHGMCCRCHVRRISTCAASRVVPPLPKSRRRSRSKAAWAAQLILRPRKVSEIASRVTDPLCRSAARSAPLQFTSAVAARWGLLVRGASALADARASRAFRALHLDAMGRAVCLWRRGGT